MSGGLSHHSLAPSERTNLRELPDMQWDGGLGNASRGSDGIYVEQGFDLRAALGSLDAPIVEVGGPTPAGYSLLQDVALSAELIITNIHGKNGTEDVDVRLDVRRFPYPDDSLGMVIASAIDIMSLEKQKKLHASFDRTTENVAAELQKVHEENAVEYAAAINLILIGKADRVDSPRIATIAQARRSLQLGGFLLFRCILLRDLEIAKELDFRLVAHTPPIEVNIMGAETEIVPREVLFQKQ